MQNCSKPKLKGRQLEILLALTHGKTVKQIAKDYGISISTVYTHIHRIRCHLGASNLVQATLIAVEHKIITPQTL